MCVFVFGLTFIQVCAIFLKEVGHFTIYQDSSTLMNISQKVLKNILHQVDDLGVSHGRKKRKGRKKIKHAEENKNLLPKSHSVTATFSLILLINLASFNIFEIFYFFLPLSLRTGDIDQLYKLQILTFRVLKRQDLIGSLDMIHSITITHNSLF